jgi:pSer/pThr/pTyr-binding forkhead associated (FHA) protein
MANWVLKFISGKYQGGEFPLEEGTVCGVGRANDSDMVLVEDMVSRNHARIMVIDDVPILEDLGSTNGSFVNGERVKKVELKDGDRILFGTSIIRLVRAEGTNLPSPEQVRPDEGGTTTPPAASGPPPSAPAIPAGNANRTMAIRADEMPFAKPSSPLAEAAAKLPTDPGRSMPTKGPRTGGGIMSGQLEEIALPDLLQLFSTGRKSGTLHLECDKNATLYIRDGRVIFAEIDEADIHPEKAAYRIMTWTAGTFIFDVPTERDFPTTIDMGTESLMMEAMRISDEINALRDAPERAATLRIATPLQPPLRSLTPEILDTLQLIINHQVVGDILDRSLANDLETLQDVIYLIQHHYIESVG